MATNMIARKSGENYEIYAEDEMIGVANYVSGTRIKAFCGQFRYRDRDLVVSRPIHIRGILSEVRSFVDMTETLKSIERFENKVRRAAAIEKIG